MWKRNLNILLIAFIILLGLNLFACNEDLDLSIEDDVINENQIISEKPRSRGNDNDEEFDDPKLLINQKNKNERAQNNPNIPHGMPQAGIPMGGIPHGGYPTGSMPIPQAEDEKKLNFSLYEVLMLTFIIAFVLNCFYGKNLNENLAQKWYSVNKEYLEENYAHIGVGSEYNTNKGVPLLKESYNNFKFYASGRKFIKWMLVNMDFKKRQDLVSLCTSIFLFNEKDKIVFECSIVPPQDLPLVFCITKKKDVKSMKKNYSDIDYFTKAYNPGFMSDNLVFLTEDMESFDTMLCDKEFLAAYSKVQPYIDIIYHTDRQTYTKEENAIFFSFDLNTSAKNMGVHLADLTNFVHIFIDLICTAKVPSSHRKEAERTRVEFDKFRAKELQERNAEEMRQKKMEKLNSKHNTKGLTVEQAQKLEEKNKKEAMKEKQKKQFKVVKK